MMGSIIQGFIIVLRLYRQGDIHAPLGRYCCRIPHSGGEMRTFCANLVGANLVGE